MRTKLRHFRELVTAFAVLVGACGGEAASAQDQHAIMGSWAVESHETRTGDEAEWREAGQPCRLDNVEEFGAAGKWTVYDGTNKCAAGTGISTGTWRVGAADTKLIVTYDGEAGEYETTIEKLDAQELVVSWGAGDRGNTQFRVRYVRP